MQIAAAADIGAVRILASMEKDSAGGLGAVLGEAGAWALAGHAFFILGRKFEPLLFRR